MSASFSAEIHLTEETVGDVREIYESIHPEVEDIEGRSKSTMVFGDDSITIEVESPDPVSLRASVNTWLQLVSTAENIDIQ